MKSHSKFFLLPAMVALAGCAARAALPPLDPNHPASPDAPEAALVEPTPTLRESVAPAESEPETAPHHGHSMHGGGGHEEHAR